MEIESKYKALNEIEHILFRPGMYIGSTKTESKNKFIYNKEENKFIDQAVNYIPGMLKIVDEVISNSIDEYRRPENLGIDLINVTVYSEGTIKVCDNGGIPVVVHKEFGCYIPELIFGRFRTSSNYNDDEDRNGVGTNGVGAKLTNIYSTRFEVFTADGNNSFYQKWTNNMRTKNETAKVVTCEDHFTETTFKIDFSKFDDFEENHITDQFARVIEKRCIDAAAANPGLRIEFTYIDSITNSVLINSEWEFDAFEEYMKLYSDYVDQENCISFQMQKQKCWIFPDGNLNIGFVNGVECNAGTHVASLRYDINNVIARKLKVSNNIEVSSKSINNKYSLFCIVDVRNPKYDSQTKEVLDTAPEKFDISGKKYKVPETFLKEVENSEIVNIVLDWYKQKLTAENSKETRKINKMLKNRVRNDKFIDANSKNRKECELWIFEGDSAKSGFRYARTPQTQGCYLLRGVIKNTLTENHKGITANTELRELISVLGLQLGVKNDVSKLNFGKIVICTDMDHDGDKIASLLLVFFNTHFPELIEAGIVCRALSPIITAQKNGKLKEYFSFEEYKADEPNLNGYLIKYTKGLGGLEDYEYKAMMQNPKYHYFNRDASTNKSIYIWFGNDASLRRNEMSAIV